VVVAPPARRDLRRLPSKATAAVLETLDVVARIRGRLGKPLQLELEGRWSARRGSYRVIYRFDENDRTVIALAIGHRADVDRPR
jgi:mRNA interferase RelE/StbE